MPIEGVAPISKGNSGQGVQKTATTGGGYGGGSGGGGGGGGPTQKEQDAFGNLGALTGYNRDTVTGQYDDQMSVYDTADQMNQALRDENIRQAKQSAGSDWFKQHKKLQSTASALNDRSGNAMRGSYLYDYADLLGAADDAIDSETLDTQRENVGQALMGYFESKMEDVNNRNQAAANTEQGLRELYADYIAQGNNINPDLVNGLIDRAGHNLRSSDWLNTDFFESHRVEAATPEKQQLYRPDAANQGANGLRDDGWNTSSSAAGDYWSRMRAGYDNRNRQA